MDLPVPYEVRRFRADVPLVNGDVSPDGRYLLTGSYTGGVVILWDLQTGMEIRRFAGQYDTVSGYISPDGRLAVLASAGNMAGTSERKFVLVDLETGQELHRFYSRYPMRNVEFSPDGRFVMIGTLAWGSEYPDLGAGDLMLWDVESGALVCQFDEHRAIQGLEFSPDGKLVATSSGDFGDVNPGIHGYVKVWEVASGALLHQYDDWASLQIPADLVWDLNGRDLLVGGYGRVGRLNVETGQITQFYDGLTYNALAMDLSRDGRFVAGGEWHDPGRLAVWDVASGKQILNVVAHNGPVWTVVFHPNGRTVFTGGFSDEEIIEWRVVDYTLDELRAWIAANRYVRDFTCEERMQYDIPPLCNEQ
jgi:WD40 repeat protein